MEIAYDLKTHKLGVLADETDGGIRYIPAHNMSQRQRDNIIMRNVTVPALLNEYLTSHTTNRVNEFKRLYEGMVKGKINLDVFLLRKVLAEVEWERNWRIR